MMSILFAIISGIAMSIQGIFNTRLSEKIGLWETNVIVQATALVITLLISVFLKKFGYKNITNVNKLYLLGGVLGVIIIFTVMKSMSAMGATTSVSIILISQLLSAALIDAFALFDTQKISFGFKEILGVLIMICGIIVFKWNK